MQHSKRIHFIAIGGSIMHNLAIALKETGHKISGSDDEFFEPSKSRLQLNGLISDPGWDEKKITKDIDAIILGMHARADNPELIKAQELGIQVYSFPEFIYEQSRDKQRIVIAGSHGKTSITAMILHVLKTLGKDFDYAVGAQIDGFDNMVKLSGAPIIIIEGDEYLSSTLDKRPKFLNYHHHIGLVSGISWDHINVFPLMDDYVAQFDLFADSTTKAGTLIYCEEDNLGTVVCAKERADVRQIPYQTHKYHIENNTTFLVTEQGDIAVDVFGKHNMQNISGAQEVLKCIGVTDEEFYRAIKTFKGAASRLELIARSEETVVFKDYAHAPSKLSATTHAVKEQFSDKKVVACLELHTFSSLNKEFLSQYNGAFNDTDYPIIYYNPKTVEHKKLQPISVTDIKESFNNNKLEIFDDSSLLEKHLTNTDWKGKVLLMMSSGNFDGINIKSLGEAIV